VAEGRCRQTFVSARATALALVVLLAQFDGVAGQSEFRLIREIGVEIGPEEYSFGRVTGVRLAPDGAIFVLDAQAKHVRKYDSNGRYLTTFGRGGAGPGEFEWPYRLHVTHDQVLITDLRLRRITAFSHSGSLIRTMTVPAPLAGAGEAFPLRGGAWLGTGSQVGFGTSWVRRFLSVPPASRGELHREFRSAAREHLLLHRPGFSGADTLFSWDLGTIWYYGNETGFPISSLSTNYGAGGAWALLGDSLLGVVDRYTGAVTIMKVGAGGAQQVRSGRLAISPRRLEGADVQRLVTAQRLTRSIPAGIDVIAPEYRAQLGAPPLFANDGSLWIPREAPDPERHAREVGRTYLVIPIDGSRQRLVVFPPSFVPSAIYDGVVVGRVRTAMDVDKIQIWQMAP
jgi:hypothetical protein